MASGGMDFHAESIMQHASFSFVLPNAGNLFYFDRGLAWAPSQDKRTNSRAPLPQGGFPRAAPSGNVTGG